MSFVRAAGKQYSLDARTRGGPSSREEVCCDIFHAMLLALQFPGSPEELTLDEEIPSKDAALRPALLLRLSASNSIVTAIGAMSRLSLL